MGKKYVIVSDLGSIHNYWLWQGTPRRPVPTPFKERAGAYIVPIAGRQEWRDGKLYTGSIYTNRLKATEDMAAFMQISAFQSARESNSAYPKTSIRVDEYDPRTHSPISPEWENNVCTGPSDPTKHEFKDTGSGEYERACEGETER